MALSPTMRETLRRMLNNVGEITRRKGGYWTTQSTRGFDWSVGIRTLRALEARGLVYVDEFMHQPAFYSGPLCYRLTCEGYEIGERETRNGT